MLICLASRRLVLVLLVVVALVLGFHATGNPAAAPILPTIDQPIIATFYTGELTLTGAGFGDPPVSSAVRFEYGGRSSIVPGDSPRVQVWQDDVVKLSLPPEVQSGQVAVTVGDVTGDPADLLVYSYAAVEIPNAVGTQDPPLAVAVTPDGALWFNQEFHLELKALSTDVPPAYTALAIPQAEGAGIFASTLFDVDHRSRITNLGEDIAVGADGRVWFTQGGANFYPEDGAYLNTSRVVGYDPATDIFECYNAPIDNAAVTGVLVDEQRNMIWYSEGNVENGNAIAGFVPNGTLSNCFFDPYGEEPRDSICTDGPADTCHWRFSLPNPHSYPAHLALDDGGNIWFTESFGNRIGRLTPETGEIIELPLPAPLVGEGPGQLVGSAGPWELAFDDSGDLWVSEYFDATVMRVRPSLMESSDCHRLDAQGGNPCIEEVLVASDGTDDINIHTVSVGADGLIWFGMERDLDDDRLSDTATLGFVFPAHGGAVTFLPSIDDVRWIAGVVQDRASRDVWFAQFSDHSIGRLRQLGAGDADGDGVLDSEDNCVTVPNPDQEEVRPGGPGTACADSDTDGDGCTDSEELGASPRLGGQRDPDNPWDYFNPTRDGTNRIDDVIAVMDHYFASEGEPAYDPIYDRSYLGPNYWNLGAPDSQIRVDDILHVAKQFFHDCER